MYRLQRPLINPLFLGTALTVIYLAAFRAEASEHCLPYPSAPVNQKVQMVRGGDVRDLLDKLRNALPDTTLQLQAGVYRLAPNQSLETRTPRITIRGRPGDREAVIIDGGYNNISINSDEVTVADITLRNPRFHNIQVRGEKGISQTIIYNVHLLDAGQQFIKISAGDGLANKFADDGLVACSLIEYSTYSRGTGSTPPSYTNGVDIPAGKGWIIRDNVFRRIRSQAGPAGPTILVWRNSLDTVVQRNVIIDSWRGIAVGLSVPNTRSRGGSGVIYDHQNGLVEDNVILALNEPADAAIENNHAANSRVFHNTVFYNPKIKHAVNWSIEYRFPATTAEIKNNLTNLPIIKRQPLPKQEAIMDGNVTNAVETWFRDVMAGDMRLNANAPVIDRGVLLSDLQTEPEERRRFLGKAPDVGAYEYDPSTNR